MFHMVSYFCDLVFIFLLHILENGYIKDTGCTFLILYLITVRSITYLLSYILKYTIYSDILLNRKKLHL
jgi:hypothetical protein